MSDVSSDKMRAARVAAQRRTNPRWGRRMAQGFGCGPRSPERLTHSCRIGRRIALVGKDGFAVRQRVERHCLDAFR
jgi:hypothetical protein